MKSDQLVIDLSNISLPQFIERFDSLYEHSPWGAEAVWVEISTADRIEVGDLAARLRNVVDRATDAHKMCFLHAPPEAAGKAAVQDELTPESTMSSRVRGLTSSTRAYSAIC